MRLGRVWENIMSYMSSPEGTYDRIDLSCSMRSYSWSIQRCDALTLSGNPRVAVSLYLTVHRDRSCFHSAAVCRNTKDLYLLSSEGLKKE